MTKKQEPESENMEDQPRLVPVRLIEHRGQSALVEWLDDEARYCRAYVPLASLVDGACPPTELVRGIPYGIHWEDLITVTATPESIANELRRRGVWRWQDIDNAALSAANRAFDQGEFLRRVAKEAKHE